PVRVLPMQGNILPHALAFSPDGRRLATAIGHGMVHLWDLLSENLPPVVLRILEGEVICLTFSPDGHRLAIRGGDGPIRIWDAGSTGQEMRRFRDATATRPVTFTPDGHRLLVLGGSTNMPMAYDVVSGQKLPG